MKLAVGRNDGVVKSLTSYGAAVTWAAATAWRVTELSWSHIAKPADILSVGDSASAS